MGDAAHAMVPFQGSGAGQGIEACFHPVQKSLATDESCQDAFLLATVLGHPSTTLETIPRALAVYDKLRRSFSCEVAVRSMLSGRMCAWQTGDISLAEFGERMTKVLEWTWLTDMEDALRDAVEILDSKPGARVI